MNFGEGCLLTNTQIIQSERSGGTSIETWQKVYVYSQQYTTVREDQSLQGNAHVLGKELINWINMSCSFSILSAACQQTFKCMQESLNAECKDNNLNILHLFSPPHYSIAPDGT